MNIKKLFNTFLFTFFALFFSSVSSAVTVVGSGSTFEIIIGEGFDGVDGDEREAVFIAGAKFWADILVSPVPIVVDAEFSLTLTCTSTTATLGSAGPASSFLSTNVANSIGLQGNVMYPTALINAYNGRDRFSRSADISASFNARLGDSDCLSNRGWYYGLDGNTPFNQIDLFDIVRHELGHGLGILSLVNDDGTDRNRVDIFTTFLHDQSTGKDWTDMSNTERNTSVTNTGNVVWSGAEVTALAGTLSRGVNSGKVQLHAPNPHSSGSSISHFDSALRPNELMEPSYNSRSTSIHSIALLKDIGWSVVVTQSNDIPDNNIPSISGQFSLTTNEDTSLTLTLNDLSVVDSDNNFPTDFSLAVSNGNNYSVLGNTITPDRNYSGLLTVPVTVNDGSNTSNIFNLVITVNEINDVPIIIGSPVTSVIGGRNYSFTPTVSDIDIGDTQTFSISNKPSWAIFNTSTGSLTGTPTNSFVGTTSNVVITVTDRAGAVASLAAFSITVIQSNINEAPIASGQTLSVNEDNDLTVTLNAEDFDNDDLTYSIVTEPSNGTLVQSSNNTWVYSPEDNYNGNDSFSYKAMDAALSSSNAVVNITIQPINDAPIAQDDFITLTYTADGRYELNVLSNDSDVDGDDLNIIEANSNVGSVSISAGQLIYQIEGLVTENIELTYTVNDGSAQSGSSTATVTVIFDGNVDALLPVITLPDDIEINATGLFTKVDLGVATATNRKGEKIPVSLVDNTVQFLPGNNIVYWQAEDGDSLQQVVSQRVDIHPLINITTDRKGVEGEDYKIAVHLNGESPNYPVSVLYNVSGNADGDDHNLTSGELIIESGLVGYIEFTTFKDDITEADENIIITLENTVNLGTKSIFTFTLTENNIAPQVNLMVSQNNEQRTIIDKTLGDVVITSEVSDDNIDDNHTYTWESTGTTGTELIDIDTNNTRFTFDPTNLASGQQIITLTVTDNGNAPLSNQAFAYIDIVETLPTLTAGDQDGDLIPDNIEGYGDTDSDGIANYLDNIVSCNVQPQIVGEYSQFYIETELGYCLSKGIHTVNNASGSLLLSANEVTPDEAAVNIGGIFDFILTGLPIAGESISLVIPQRLPVPENAHYRKVNSEGVWNDFMVDENNYYSSAAGERGYCPAPNSDSWTMGLTEGHWCVQLTIEDGGSNDDDGLANHQIIDPGGISVLINANTLPAVANDELTTFQNTAVTIDVLANDTDIDNDTLTLLSANVDFGSVSIVNQQLLYQPDFNFLGLATISYNVSDGNSGTGFGDAFITVISNPIINTIPTTNEDTTNTDTVTTEEINDSNGGGNGGSDGGDSGGGSLGIFVLFISMTILFIRAKYVISTR